MIEMEDDELERRLSFSHHGGIAAGLESVEQEAKRRAGEEFANRRDEQACLWRKVAIWLGELACEARKTQKKYQNVFRGGGV
jgi:hypothetical protein